MSGGQALPMPGLLSRPAKDMGTGASWPEQARRGADRAPLPH